MMNLIACIFGDPWNKEHPKKKGQWKKIESLIPL
jgi:hypothetical protein